MATYQESEYVVKIKQMPLMATTPRAKTPPLLASTDAWGVTGRLVLLWGINCPRRTIIRTRRSRARFAGD
jgi:hypothetical protein